MAWGYSCRASLCACNSPDHARTQIQPGRFVKPKRQGRAVQTARTNQSHNELEEVGQEDSKEQSVSQRTNL